MRTESFHLSVVAKLVIFLKFGKNSHFGQKGSFFIHYYLGNLLLHVNYYGFIFQETFIPVSKKRRKSEIIKI